MLEARRRQIPAVGLQHGFIYRHWLNYLHEADEMAPAGSDRGCPIPDRTLLFDRYAEGHLRTAGRFPNGSLEVTGNARLDLLQAQCAALRPGREAIRRDLGVAGDQPVVVLAAKHSEIRGALPDLVTAVRELASLRLFIKTHPAETPEAYAAAVSGAPNIAVLPAASDLARLLVAADALVTMNSTVAIDGLVLGVPAVVIGLPNNLSPFVDAGAMLGANGSAAIGRALRSLLYDAEARRAMLACGAEFARRFALASDGHAADRAAAAILALAGRDAGERTTRGS
jgi:predicted glycosyltransferase